MTDPHPASREPASFRDPLGHIVYADGRIIRRLAPGGVEIFQSFFESLLYKSLAERQMVVQTEKLTDGGFADEKYPLAVEHEKIPFISYAFEWPFEMLRDAALFTLDILIESLEKGFVLRDGSSNNVQFKDGKPIFIDILSFAPYREGDIWIGYSQFCRMMLFPLMLAAHKGADYRHWLKGNIYGISLDDMAGIFGWSDFYKSGVLFQVLLQKKLSAKPGKTANSNKRSNMTAAKLILIVKQLKGVASSLQSPFEKTEWAEYTDFHSYNDESFLAKRNFVEKICSARKRKLVWDIGANTGEYSKIAAPHANLVVALDADHGAVERLYVDMRKSGIKNVLPLMADAADPAGGGGWLSGETKNLTDRGRPELVLALALIHHLCIGRNVMLESFVDWLTGISPEGVVEFVSKEDRMVKHLLATREDIFASYTKSNFESLLGTKAEILETVELVPSKRYLYHYKTK